MRTYVAFEMIVAPFGMNMPLCTSSAVEAWERLYSWAECAYEKNR